MSFFVFIKNKINFSFSLFLYFRFPLGERGLTKQNHLLAGFSNLGHASALDLCEGIRKSYLKSAFQFFGNIRIVSCKSRYFSFQSPASLAGVKILFCGPSVSKTLRA